MEKQNDNICTERQNDDYDKVIRKLIEKETDIVDTKIRWSFLMHSVLFTAYWEVTKSINEDKAWYIWGLIFIGICFSISSIYTVWSSERAIAFILSKWDKYILDRGFSYDDFPPVWAGCTEAINNYIGVEKQTTKKIYEKIYFHMGGMSMYNMIPKLFLLVWLVVLFVNLLSLCLNLLS